MLPWCPVQCVLHFWTNKFIDWLIDWYWTSRCEPWRWVIKDFRVYRQWPNKAEHMKRSGAPPSLLFQAALRYLYVFHSWVSAGKLKAPPGTDGKKSKDVFRGRAHGPKVIHLKVTHRRRWRLQKVIRILGCNVWLGAKYELRHLLSPTFSVVHRPIWTFFNVVKQCCRLSVYGVAKAPASDEVKTLNALPMTVRISLQF